MKKTLLIVVVLIIAVIAGGVYYVLTNLDSLVKQAIEKYGSEATQTAVRVQRVNIQLKQASAAISGLTVANPKGFDIPNAFSLGQIATRLNVKGMSKDHIVIDEVRVQAPEVFYEINADKQGNLNLLKDKLIGGAKAGAAGEKPATQTGAKPPMITIHKFVFADAALHAKLVPLKNKEFNLKLPSFELVNLSGTPQQIGKQVMNQLIDRAREEIRKQGIDAELEKAKAQVKEKVETEKAKLKEKADTRIEEEKAKAADKLKNLLGK
jgi:uncharacterized protein involved in outer membrane biogenesis